MKTKYRNVVISGLPGAGSTTLGRLLAEKLDWKFYSGGDFMRQYAIENGYFEPEGGKHHSATAYPDDFDRKVDYGMRKKLQEQEGRVYESWLSGFLAQQVPDTLKILMHCSEDSIRVDRLANRDETTINDAKGHIFQREKSNLAKWQRMYPTDWRDWVVKPGTVGKDEEIYFWNPKLYDLSIDTFKYGREETLQLALEVFYSGK